MSRPAGPAEAEVQGSAVPSPSVPSGSQVAARVWRAGRVWLIVAALLMILGALALFRPAPTGGALHPESARPAGGMAIAEVLRGQGIRIHHADSADQALELAQEHPEATLLFHDPAGLLPDQGLDRLAEGTDPARRVLVEPDLAQIRALATGITTGPGLTPSEEPLTAGTDCALPLARQAESMVRDGRLYRGGTGCFNGISAPAGEVRPAHGVVRSDDGTWVIGSAQVFANAGAADHGHPVVALWTLGQGEDVIWYLPTLADVPVGEAPTNPSDLLPAWVGPVIWWLVVCALVLMLWRGRRHGPLAIEPLPVVVPSSETAVGRARLYQSTGQAGAAARSLHQATRLRLARLLRLGRGATAPALSSAVAAVTGQDPAAVAHLLDESTVDSNAALVDRARALQGLEQSVHAALGAAGPAQPAPPAHPTDLSTQDPRGPETTP